MAQLGVVRHPAIQCHLFEHDSFEADECNQSAGNERAEHLHRASLVVALSSQHGLSALHRLASASGLSYLSSFSYLFYVRDA